jgi:hypothetical protein
MTNAIIITLTLLLFVQIGSVATKAISNEAHRAVWSTD